VLTDLVARAGAQKRPFRLKESRAATAREAVSCSDAVEVPSNVDDLVSRRDMKSRMFNGVFAALLGVVLGGCVTPSKQTDTSAPGSAPRVQSSSAENGRNWNRRLAEAVLPNIAYPATAPKPPRSAEFMVFMNSEGSITEKSLLNTSGSPEWDRAASLALRNTVRLPADESGQAPYQAVISISSNFVTGAVIQRKPDPRIGPASRLSEGNYAAWLAAAVRPNILFLHPEQISGNPGAEFDVSLAPNGDIVSIVLSKSSGWPDWDVAAQRALQRTERFPRDVDGKVPSRLFLTLRPKL